PSTAPAGVAPQPMNRNAAIVRARSRSGVIACTELVTLMLYSCRPRPDANIAAVTNADTTSGGPNAAGTSASDNAITAAPPTATPGTLHARVARRASTAPSTAPTAPTE